MEALIFLAGGTLCAARMEQVEKVYARAEVAVRDGILLVLDESLTVVDLTRLFEPGARQLKAEVNFLRFQAQPGLIFKVDQILTRVEMAATTLHLLPAFSFGPGRQYFSHLIDLGDYQAFLLDPRSLTAASRASAVGAAGEEAGAA